MDIDLTRTPGPTPGTTASGEKDALTRTKNHKATHNHASTPPPQLNGHTRADRGLLAEAAPEGELDGAGGVEEEVKELVLPHVGPDALPLDGHDEVTRQDPGPGGGPARVHAGDQHLEAGRAAHEPNRTAKRP